MLTSIHRACHFRQMRHKIMLQELVVAHIGLAPAFQKISPEGQKKELRGVC